MGIPGVQRRQIGEQQRKSRPLLLLPQGAGPAGFCLHVGPDEDRELARQPFTKQEAQMKFIAATLATLSMLVSASAQADPTKTREDVRMVAPALEKYAQNTLLGDVWKRPGLSVRDRSVVTLAALIARNQTVEMAYYLNVALDNGVKPAEISEIITHLAFSSGWSNAMAAVAVAKDGFAERKIAADQVPAASPNLLALDEAAAGDRAQRVGEQFC